LTALIVLFSVAAFAQEFEPFTLDRIADDLKVDLILTAFGIHFLAVFLAIEAYMVEL
jgi:hypothetical protein